MRFSKQKNQFFPKLISAFILITFTTTSVSWGAPSISSEVKVLSPEIKIGQFAERITVPVELGSIKETYIPPSHSALSTQGSGLVVHLEDAHGSVEAQLHQEKILRHLQEQYGLKTFFVEGGIGELRPELLRFFKDSEINEKLIDKLTEVGIVGGVERFLVNQTTDLRPQPTARKTKALAPVSSLQSPVHAFGVESVELYRRELELFREVYNGKTESDKFLGKMRQALLAQSASLTNKELKTFFRGWLFQEELQKDILFHLSFLEKYARETLSLDLTDAREQYDWPALVRFFKLKKTEQEAGSGERLAESEKQKLIIWIQEQKLDGSQDLIDFLNSERSTLHAPRYSVLRSTLERFYEAASPAGFKFTDYPALSKQIGLAILSSEIQAPDLLKEIERLNERILGKLAAAPEEKNLIADYQNYFLLRKLFALELTREEFGRFQAELRGTANGERKTFSLPVTRSPLPVAAALEFYEIAKDREEAMFSNMLRTMKARGEPNAVLITGGFHSDGLSKFFKDSGLSYVRIAPRISGKVDDTNYLRLMTGGLSPSSRGPLPASHARFASMANTPAALDPRTAGVIRAELRNAMQEMKGEPNPANKWLLPDKHPALQEIPGVREVVPASRSEARKKGGDSKGQRETEELFPHDKQTTVDELKRFMPGYDDPAIQKLIENPDELEKALYKNVPDIQDAVRFLGFEVVEENGKLYIQDPIFTKRLYFRAYQVMLAAKSLSEGGVVVLPTGMGKTYVAVLVIGHLLKNNPPHFKILLTAPSNVLTAQHTETLSFSEEEGTAKLDGFFKAGTVTLITSDTPRESKTGKRKTRKELLREHQVIITTNELAMSRLEPFPVGEFDWFFIDEAHRIGSAEEHNYAGTKLVREFRSRKDRKPQGKILALTASPPLPEDFGKWLETLRFNKTHVHAATDTDAWIWPYFQKRILRYKPVEWDMKPDLVSAILDYLEFLATQSGMVGATKRFERARKDLLEASGKRKKTADLLDALARDLSSAPEVTRWKEQYGEELKFLHRVRTELLENLFEAEKGLKANISIDLLQWAPWFSSIKPSTEAFRSFHQAAVQALGWLISFNAARDLQAIEREAVIDLYNLFLKRVEIDRKKTPPDTEQQGEIFDRKTFELPPASEVDTDKLIEIMSQYQSPKAQSEKEGKSGKKSRRDGFLEMPKDLGGAYQDIKDEMNGKPLKNEHGEIIGRTPGIFDGLKEAKNNFYQARRRPLPAADLQSYQEKITELEDRLAELNLERDRLNGLVRKDLLGYLRKTIDQYGPNYLADAVGEEPDPELEIDGLTVEAAFHKKKKGANWRNYVLPRLKKHHIPELSRWLRDHEVRSPKIKIMAETLKEVLAETNETGGVFAENIKVAKDAARIIEAWTGLKFAVLVGGSKMGPKAQTAVVKGMNDKTFRGAVGTSVMREGLNINGLKIVLELVPSASAIEQIQRWGRVARFMTGIVLTLVFKGFPGLESYDYKIFWKTHGEYKRIQNLIHELQQENPYTKFRRPLSHDTVTASAPAAVTKTKARRASNPEGDSNQLTLFRSEMRVAESAMSMFGEILQESGVAPALALTLDRIFCGGMILIGSLMTLFFVKTAIRGLRNVPPKEISGLFKKGRASEEDEEGADKKPSPRSLYGRFIPWEEIGNYPVEVGEDIRKYESASAVREGVLKGIFPYFDSQKKGLVAGAFIEITRLKDEVQVRFLRAPRTEWKRVPELFIKQKIDQEGAGSIRFSYDLSYDRTDGDGDKFDEVFYKQNVILAGWTEADDASPAPSKDGKRDLSGEQSKIFKKEQMSLKTQRGVYFSFLRANKLLRNKEIYWWTIKYMDYLMVGLFMGAIYEYMEQTGTLKWANLLELMVPTLLVLAGGPWVTARTVAYSRDRRDARSDEPAETSVWERRVQSQNVLAKIKRNYVQYGFVNMAMMALFITLIPGSLFAGAPGSLLLFVLSPVVFFAVKMIYDYAFDVFIDLLAEGEEEIDTHEGFSSEQAVRKGLAPYFDCFSSISTRFLNILDLGAFLLGYGLLGLGMLHRFLPAAFMIAGVSITLGFLYPLFFFGDRHGLRVDFETDVFIPTEKPNRYGFGKAYLELNPRDLRIRFTAEPVSSGNGTSRLSWGAQDLRPTLIYPGEPVLRWRGWGPWASVKITFENTPDVVVRAGGPFLKKSDVTKEHIPEDGWIVRIGHLPKPLLAPKKIAEPPPASTDSQKSPPVPAETNPSTADMSAAAAPASEPLAEKDSTRSEMREGDPGEEEPVAYLTANSQDGIWQDERGQPSSEESLEGRNAFIIQQEQSLLIGRDIRIQVIGFFNHALEKTRGEPPFVELRIEAPSQHLIFRKEFYGKIKGGIRERGTENKKGSLALTLAQGQSFVMGTRDVLNKGKESEMIEVEALQIDPSKRQVSLKVSAPRGWIIIPEKTLGIGAFSRAEMREINKSEAVRFLRVFRPVGPEAEIRKNLKNAEDPVLAGSRNRSWELWNKISPEVRKEMEGFLKDRILYWRNIFLERWKNGEKGQTDQLVRWSGGIGMKGEDAAPWISGDAAWSKEVPWDPVQITGPILFVFIHEASAGFLQWAELEASKQGLARDPFLSSLLTDIRFAQLMALTFYFRNSEHTFRGMPVTMLAPANEVTAAATHAGETLAGEGSLLEKEDPPQTFSIWQWLIGSSQKAKTIFAKPEAAAWHRRVITLSEDTVRKLFSEEPEDKKKLEFLKTVFSEFMPFIMNEAETSSGSFSEEALAYISKNLGFENLFDFSKIRNSGFIRQWLQEQKRHWPELKQVPGEEPFSNLRTSLENFYERMVLAGALDLRQWEVVEGGKRSWANWLLHDSAGLLMVLRGFLEILPAEIEKWSMAQDHQLRQTLLNRIAEDYVAMEHSYEKLNLVFGLSLEVAQAVEQGIPKKDWPQGAGETLPLERTELFDWFVYQVFFNHENATEHHAVFQEISGEIKRILSEIKKMFEKANAQIMRVMSEDPSWHGNLEKARQKLHIRSEARNQEENPEIQGPSQAQRQTEEGFSITFVNSEALASKNKGIVSARHLISQKIMEEGGNRWDVEHFWYDITKGTRLLWVASSAEEAIGFCSFLKNPKKASEAYIEEIYFWSNREDRERIGRWFFKQAFQELISRGIQRIKAGSQKEIWIGTTPYEILPISAGDSIQNIYKDLAREAKKRGGLLKTGYDAAGHLTRLEIDVKQYVQQESSPRQRSEMRDPPSLQRSEGRIRPDLRAKMRRKDGPVSEMEQSFQIQNPEGIHLRPAVAVSTLARTIHDSLGIHVFAQKKGAKIRTEINDEFKAQGLGLESGDTVLITLKGENGKKLFPESYQKIFRVFEKLLEDGEALEAALQGAKGLPYREEIFSIKREGGMRRSEMRGKVAIPLPGDFAREGDRLIIFPPAGDTLSISVFKPVGILKILRDLEHRIELVFSDHPYRMLVPLLTLVGYTFPRHPAAEDLSRLREAIRRLFGYYGKDAQVNKGSVAFPREWLAALNARPSDLVVVPVREHHLKIQKRSEARDTEGPIGGVARQLRNGVSTEKVSIGKLLEMDAADGKTRIPIGTVILADGWDTSYDEPKELGSYAQTLVSKLRGYGFSVSLENLQLPGDQSPTRHFGSFEYEYFLVVDETYRAFLVEFIEKLCSRLTFNNTRTRNFLPRGEEDIDLQIQETFSSIIKALGDADKQKRTQAQNILKMWRQAFDQLADMQAPAVKKTLEIAVRTFLNMDHFVPEHTGWASSEKETSHEVIGAWIESVVRQHRDFVGDEVLSDLVLGLSRSDPYIQEVSLNILRTFVDSDWERLMRIKGILEQKGGSNGRIALTTEAISTENAHNVDSWHVLHGPRLVRDLHEFGIPVDLESTLVESEVYYHSESHYTEDKMRLWLVYPVNQTISVFLYLIFWRASDELRSKIFKNLPQTTSTLEDSLASLGIQEMPDEKFRSIYQAAIRINPNLDLKALFEIYKNKKSSLPCVLETDEAGMVKVMINESAERLDGPEDDERFLTGRQQGTTKEENSSFLTFLKEKFGISNAYLSHYRSIEDQDPARHFFTGVAQDFLVVPRAFGELMALYHAAGDIPMRRILLGEFSEIEARIESGTRRLGHGPYHANMGNKEAGFLIFEKLGLPYPPGIALDENLVAVLANLSNEESKNYLPFLDRQLNRAGINVRFYEWWKWSGENEPVIVRSNPKRSMPGILDSIRVSYDLINTIQEITRAWETDKAKAFRKREKIEDHFDLPLIIQHWVSGKSPYQSYHSAQPDNDKSLLYFSGAFSTRDPNTSRSVLFGQCLENATGDELMTGGKVGKDINELAKAAPKIYQQLVEAAKKLEEAVGPQEVEFVVSDGKLYFIQTRKINFSPQAEVTYLEEQLASGKITEARAIPRLEQLQEKLKTRKLFKVKGSYAAMPVAKSLASTPGAFQGRLVWTEEVARRYMDEHEAIIFVAHKENQNTVLSLIFDYPHSGLITNYGNSSSHEAVLTRLAGIPSLINLQVSQWEDGAFTLESGQRLKEGDRVVIDGDRNSLFISDQEVLEEDGAVLDASYGIDIPAFRKEFLAAYEEENGALKPELTVKKLELLNQQAEAKYLSLKDGSDAKVIFMANLEKHILHDLLIQCQKTNKISTAAPTNISPRSEIKDIQKRLEGLAADEATGLKREQIPQILAAIESGDMKLKGEESDIIKSKNGHEAVIGPIDRNIAHRYGLLHRVPDTFILTPEGKLLLQKRAHNVVEPLKISLVGGHVKAGYDYRGTIKDEIVKELGLPSGWQIDNKRLKVIRAEGAFESPAWDRLNREKRSSYLYLASAEEIAKAREMQRFLDQKLQELGKEGYKQWLEDEQKKQKGYGEVWSIHEFSYDELVNLPENDLSRDLLASLLHNPANQEIRDALKAAVPATKPQEGRRSEVRGTSKFVSVEPVIKKFDPKTTKVVLSISKATEKSTGKKWFNDDGVSRLFRDRVHGPAYVDQAGKPYDAHDPRIEQFKRTIPQFIHEYETAHPEEEVVMALPNGNLGINDWFIGVADGKVYSSARDPVAGRIYDMLVTKEDGSLAVMSLQFMKKDGARGIFDEQGNSVPGVRHAVYGQRIIKNGKGNLENLHEQFDDLRHIFRLPFFRLMRDGVEQNIELGFTDDLGELYLNRELVREALLDHPITLSLVPLLEKGLTVDVIRKKYSEWEYTDISEDPLSVVKSREFRVSSDGRSIEIGLLPAVYPHSLIGIDKQGKIFVGNTPAGDSKFKGLRLPDLVRDLIAQGARDVFLWANGKDLAGTRNSRGTGLEAILLTQQRSARRVLTNKSDSSIPLEGRSEARGEKPGQPIPAAPSTVALSQEAKKEITEQNIRKMEQYFEKASVPKGIIEKIMQGLEDEFVLSSDEFLEFYENLEHGFQHSLEITRQIFEWVETFQFEVDAEALAAGAFLHDIKALSSSGNKIRRTHHEKGAESAGAILEKLNWPSKRIDRVKEIIKSHRGVPQDYTIGDYPPGYVSEEAEGMPKPVVLESKLVRDADTFIELENLERLRKITLDYRRYKGLTGKYYNSDLYGGKVAEVHKRLEVILDRSKRVAAVHADVLEFLLGKLLEHCNPDYYALPEVRDLIRKRSLDFFKEFLTLTIAEVKKQGEDPLKVIGVVENILKEMANAKTQGNEAKWTALNQFYQQTFQSVRAETRLPADASAAGKKVVADNGNKHSWEEFVPYGIKEHPAWENDPVYQEVFSRGFGSTGKLEESLVELKDTADGNHVNIPEGTTGVSLGFGDIAQELPMLLEKFALQKIHGVEWNGERVRRGAEELSRQGRSPQQFILHHGDMNNLEGIITSGSVGLVFAVGLAADPSEDTKEIRVSLAREIVRVLAPNGVALLATQGDNLRAVFEAHGRLIREGSYMVFQKASSSAEVAAGQMIEPLAAAEGRFSDQVRRPARQAPATKLTRAELRVAHDVAEDVFRAGRLARAELRQVLELLDPVAYAMETRETGHAPRATTDLMKDPSKLESGQEQISLIFDSIPQPGDPVVRMLVEVMAKSRFLSFRIAVTGVGQAELAGFKTMLDREVNKARTVKGGVNLRVVSDEAAMARLAGQHPENVLVYDMREDGAARARLVAAVTKARREKPTLFVYNDENLALSERSFALLAAINALLEKHMPENNEIQKASNILRSFAENLHIAAEAAKVIASAA